MNEARTEAMQARLQDAPSWPRHPGTAVGDVPVERDGRENNVPRDMNHPLREAGARNIRYHPEGLNRWPVEVRADRAAVG